MYVDKERAAVAGDFIKICGLEGVSNATAKVDFFGNVPSTDAGSIIMELPIAPWYMAHDVGQRPKRGRYSLTSW